MMSRFFVAPVKAAFETTGYSIAAAAVGSSVYKLTTMNDKNKESQENKSVSLEQEHSSSTTKMHF
ncbi:hypothetical protein [Legionella sp. WA2024007413]